MTEAQSRQPPLGGGLLIQWVVLTMLTSISQLAAYSWSLADLFADLACNIRHVAKKELAITAER